MKKVLIVILGIIIIIIIAVVVALFFTRDVVKSADQFFTSIRDGNVEEAYQSTAKEFQAATSLEQFKAFLEGTEIGNYDSASWTSRSIENNIGKLEGSINTKNGGVIPVNIQMVKEDDKWKILNIKKTEGGLVETTEETTETTETTETPEATGTPEIPEIQEKAIPPDNEMIAMTNNTIMTLGMAVNKDDFADFYNSVSKIWQNQTNEDALRTAFIQFINKKIDLTIMANATPVFSEKPSLDQNELLMLKGYYPTKPYMIEFTLKYIYEYPQWKLIAINIEAK